MYAFGVYDYRHAGMSRPRVYTRRTSVSMRGEHRDELEAQLTEDMTLGSMLRDAGLRVIGREDLVLEARDETGRRRVRHPDTSPPWVFVHVRLTSEQQRTLTDAAKSRSMSLSALLHDALRFELGLTPVTEAARGWKRGKRRSKPPRS